jgi:hypothetical protein
MFKSIRSSLFWYYLYKFRKRFVIVVILLFSIFLSGFIYADVVEYLKLRDKLDYLDFILPIKWFIIFTNIAIISYLILSLFASDNKEVDTKKEEININPKDLETLSQREASFLHTGKLKTKADLIIDKH